MATEETKPVEREEFEVGMVERSIRQRFRTHGDLARIDNILADFQQASADAALERAAEVVEARRYRQSRKRL